VAAAWLPDIIREQEVGLDLLNERLGAPAPGIWRDDREEGNGIRPADDRDRILRRLHLFEDPGLESGH
jgi:hypothetical protein